MNDFIRKNLPVLFIIAISAIFWLPNLFTRGMFIDGLLYGLIADNLANGVGAWWHLHGTPTMDNQLWGNPPFHIWMLSLFYTVFGNGFWIDHFYSLVTAIITLALIFFCTKEIASIENKKNDKWWVACITWLLFPGILWSYSNNVMENTMTIFSILSILFLLQYIRSEKNIFLFALLSSGSIFIAFITKGLPALFPLVAPLCFLNSKPFFTWKKGLIYTLTQCLIFIVLFFIVFSQPGPSDFLHHYVTIQLVPVLQQQYHNTSSRFFIISELIKTLILPLLALTLLIFFQRGKVSKPLVSGISFRILLIGLLASLPIIISLKQSAFYLVPSLPLFALFFGNIVTPYFERIKLSIVIQKIIASLCIVTFAVAVIFCVARAGIYGRDAEMQTDLKKISSLVGNEKMVSSGKEIYPEWSLKAYLFRDYRISDEALSDSKQHLFLIRKIDADSTPPVYHSAYKGEMFELFKK